MSVSKTNDICFIDTNIWFYAFAIAKTTDEVRKSEIAKNIIHSSKGNTKYAGHQ